MEINLMEIVGLFAGVCTTASFAPQVLHSWRTKSVEDISLRMYLLLSVGIVLWLVYGIHMQSISITLANGVTLILVLAILIMKIRYGKPSKKGFNQNP